MQYNYIKKSFTFDGKRYYVYGATEEEAILKKAERIRELESGRITSSTSVRQWSSVWMDTYVRPRGMIAKSLRVYEDELKNVILPSIGSCEMRSVTPLQLQKIVNKRTGMSFSYAKQLMGVIKEMFKQAHINRIIEFDPSAELRMPKTTKGHRRSLTDEERSALLKVASRDKIAGQQNVSGAWVLSMLYCGLRPGETAALKWDDVDLDSRTIHVRHGKEAGSSRIKSTKTLSGVRDVPIPNEYLPYLAAMPSKSGYVFKQKYGGGALTDSSMKRMWETIKRHMDIEMGATVERIKPKGRRKSVEVITHSVIADDLVLYDLRHTYCTDLEKKGVPINIAKVLMGHSDIAVTANIYTHKDASTIDLARALIDGSVG